MNDGIRSIVERARAEDQVAQALIVETRRQAAEGNAKAQYSLKLIEQYIDSHPPSDYGAETALSVDTNASGVERAQKAVWQARRSSPEYFAFIVAKAAPALRVWDIVVALAHGPKIKEGTPLYEAAKFKDSQLAQCIRCACRLQRLADPNVPISTYCRVTGSELGE